MREEGTMVKISVCLLIDATRVEPVIIGYGTWAPTVEKQ